MKIFELVTIVTVGLLGLWFAYGFIFESKIDTPSYDLIKKTSNYTIRFYPKLNIASTSSNTSNSSFRNLFKFIDGNNSTNTKIAMTAPVIMSEDTMMFVLPALSDIPEPNNKEVLIKSLTNTKVAVIGFTGSASKADRYKQKLYSYLKKDGLSTTNKWYLSQYNSPFVFPMLRKNEIWIELAQ